MLVISFATGTQRTLELSVTLLIIFHYLDLQAIFVTVINCPHLNWLQIHWLQWVGLMLVVSSATGTQRTIELSCTLLIIFHYPLLSGSTSCDQLSPPSFDRAFACRLTGETCIFELLKLHYSSCITQVALLKLNYSSCITQVAIPSCNTQVALLKLQY